jgi:hypothetical protein
LQVSRLRRTTGANHVNDARGDLDEAVVVLPEPAEQLDFVLRHELQAIHVVAELIKLAQRARQRPLVGGDQRGGNAVELRGRVVLNLAISFNLALELDVLGALMDIAQSIKSDCSHHDQEHRYGKKCNQQLELHGRWYARNQTDERAHQPRNQTSEPIKRIIAL